MSLPTIHQTPFMRFLLPMIVGILVFECFPTVWIGAIISSLAILIYGLSLYTTKGAQAFRYRYLFGISSFLAFAAIGFFLTKIQNGKSEFDFQPEKKAYRVEIKSVPEEKERSIYCQLEVESHKKIIAYFHKDSISLALKQGDHLIIYTAPQKLTNANRPGSFNFASYMQRQGFSATAYVDSAYWKKVNVARAFNLNYLASDFQKKILEIFRSFGFEENEFALLSGITIGYQDALTVEQKSNFSSVGLSHLMAVSGMQTAMIYTMLWFLLGFIPKNSRFYRLKYVVVILCLWIFTFITGLSASVVRASIMLTVMMVGGLFNKQAITLNSLVFAAFCLLLYNPYSLYDIGFQLSFMAVLTILISQDLLKGWFDRLRKVPRYFAELSTMTIAAQIGTSPLSIFYFHQFPLLFLIVNLLILPWNGILVYLACLCTFLASVGIPHAWFDKLLQLMLYSLDTMTEQFAKIPFAQIRELHPSAIEIALFYVLLTTLLLFVYKKRFRLLLYSLSVVVLLLAVLFVEKLEKQKENQLLVYNQFGRNVVEYIDKGESQLKSPNDKAVYFGGKRLLIVDKDIRHTTANGQLSCDFLILTKGFKGQKGDIERLYDCKQLIMDASLNKYYGEKIRMELHQSDINYYDMNEKGAFVLNLPKTPDR